MFCCLWESNALLVLLTRRIEISQSPSISIILIMKSAVAIVCTPQRGGINSDEVAAAADALDEWMRRAYRTATPHT